MPPRHGLSPLLPAHKSGTSDPQGRPLLPGSLWLCPGLALASQGSPRGEGREKEGQGTSHTTHRSAGDTAHTAQVAGLGPRGAAEAREPGLVHCSSTANFNLTVGLASAPPAGCPPTPVGAAWYPGLARALSPLPRQGVLPPGSALLTVATSLRIPVLFKMGKGRSQKIFPAINSSAGPRRVH